MKYFVKLKESPVLELQAPLRVYKTQDGSYFIPECIEQRVSKNVMIKNLEFNPDKVIRTWEEEVEKEEKKENFPIISKELQDWIKRKEAEQKKPNPFTPIQPSNPIPPINPWNQKLPYFPQYPWATEGIKYKFNHQSL